MRIFTELGFSVRLLTLRQFLEMVRVSPQRVDAVLYNTKTGHSRIRCNGSTTQYRRVAVRLLHGDRTEILSANLNCMAGHNIDFFKSPTKLFYDFITGYMKDFGTPEYLVRVGRRQWLCTNTDDFQIFECRGRYGLACLDMGRHVIHNVDRITEADAIASITRLKAEIKR